MKNPHSSPTAFVTGAGGGIGKAVVDRLRSSGYRVFATDMHVPDGSPEVGPTEAEHVVFHALDVRDPAAWHGAVEQMVSRWGRIDLLVQLAGYQKAGSVGTSSADDVARHLDTNLSGTVFGCQAVLAQMLEQGTGHIVNVGSLASLTPVPGMALYAASKFGVRGYTLSLAHEMRGTAIGVSLVCPGTVDTPMTTQQLHIPESAPIYANRLLDADQVAEVIVSRVLRTRALETLIPRGFGLLAKIAGLFVGLARLLAPSIIEKGERNRARIARSGD